MSDMLKWLDLIQFAPSTNISNLQMRQFLFVTSSMAYIMVWAGLCLAFIRFRSWYVWDPTAGNATNPLQV